MDDVSGKGPFWWDRDCDSSGKPIRLDVRVAAHEIWDDACQRTRIWLGEPCEAADLMESSVLQISRYLDGRGPAPSPQEIKALLIDRKSTRLNSSHRCISYAVFCLKKKKTT